MEGSLETVKSEVLCVMVVIEWKMAVTDREGERHRGFKRK